MSANRFLPVTARVVGGDGNGDEGFRDARGVVHGHYWVESTCFRTGAVWVVDITADQFGAESVRVVALERARSEYQKGNQALVDEHLRNEGFKAALR